jgi:hypothetical protein
MSRTSNFSEFLYPPSPPRARFLTIACLHPAPKPMLFLARRIFIIPSVLDVEEHALQWRLR